MYNDTTKRCKDEFQPIDADFELSERWPLDCCPNAFGALVMAFGRIEEALEMILGWGIILTNESGIGDHILFAFFIHLKRKNSPRIVRTDPRLRMITWSQWSCWYVWFHEAMQRHTSALAILEWWLWCFMGHELTSFLQSVRNQKSFSSCPSSLRGRFLHNITMFPIL